jgi:hypothetical protein
MTFNAIGLNAPLEGAGVKETIVLERGSFSSCKK